MFLKMKFMMQAAFLSCFCCLCLQQFAVAQKMTFATSGSELFRSGFIAEISIDTVIFTDRLQDIEPYKTFRLYTFIGENISWKDSLLALHTAAIIRFSSHRLYSVKAEQPGDRPPAKGKYRDDYAGISTALALLPKGNMQIQAEMLRLLHKKVWVEMDFHMSGEPVYPFHNAQVNKVLPSYRIRKTMHEKVW